MTNSNWNKICKLLTAWILACSRNGNNMNWAVLLGLTADDARYLWQLYYKAHELGRDNITLSKRGIMRLNEMWNISRQYYVCTFKLHTYVNKNIKYDKDWKNTLITSPLIY